jgi:hypothetical protein
MVGHGPILEGYVDSVNSGGWDRNVREDTVKSEKTWIRSGRPIYHHLSQDPRTVPLPSGQQMRFGLDERAL